MLFREDSLEQDTAPTTGQLSSCSPSKTDQLTHPNTFYILTTTLPRVAQNTSQRMPVVIKGTTRRSTCAPSPPAPAMHKQHRLQVAVLTTLMLTLMIVLALLSSTSLWHDMGLSSPLTMLPGSKVISGAYARADNPGIQATAMAIYQRKTDGYDPTYVGSQMMSDGSTSLAWPIGQCTYWANYEYHRLTGYWVSWNGNANQWVDGALAAGWNVSTEPHIPSIMVLQAGQGSSSQFGHVAVVEGVSGNTVHTSDMNWYANGGGWNRVSHVDFATGPGVYFIWHR